MAGRWEVGDVCLYSGVLSVEYLSQTLLIMFLYLNVGTVMQPHSTVQNTVKTQHPCLSRWWSEATKLKNVST